MAVARILLFVRDAPCGAGRHAAEPSRDRSNRRRVRYPPFSAVGRREQSAARHPCPRALAPSAGRGTGVARTCPAAPAATGRRASRSGAVRGGAVGRQRRGHPGRARRRGRRSRARPPPRPRGVRRGAERRRTRPARLGRRPGRAPAGRGRGRGAGRLVHKHQNTNDKASRDRRPEGRAVDREPRKYLDKAALARRLGVSRRTLQRWRAGGGGPPYVRLGPRRVAYDEAAGDAWAAPRSAAELAAAAGRRRATPSRGEKARAGRRRKRSIAQGRAGARRRTLPEIRGGADCGCEWLRRRRGDEAPGRAAAPRVPNAAHLQQKSGNGLPGEGFEPPAFGLQNRCTTAVLTRRAAGCSTRPGAGKRTGGAEKDQRLTGRDRSSKAVDCCGPARGQSTVERRCPQGLCGVCADDARSVLRFGPVQALAHWSEILLARPRSPWVGTPRA